MSDARGDNLHQSDADLHHRRWALWPIFTLPPPDAHTNRWVIVMHPPAVGTVISVSPAGVVTLAPPGTQGPSEIAVQKPDRLVYAPEGAAGAAFLLPSAGDDAPNAF